MPAARRLARIREARPTATGGAARTTTAGVGCGPGGAEVRRLVGRRTPQRSSASPSASSPARARRATRWSWSSRPWATPPTSCSSSPTQVSDEPPARELDMLLTAGERISMALLAMAIARPGRGRAVLHRLAGRRHHRPSPRSARIIDVTRPRPRRPRRRATWRSSPASRASTRSARTSPRSAAAAPTPRPSRLRPRWAPTCARSTPTSTACSPPIPASCRRPQARPHHLRGDAGAGGVRRQDPAAALRRVRPPLQRPHPRPLVLHRHDRHLVREEGRRHGAGHHLRRRARPLGGQGHGRRGARPSRQGRRALPRPSPTPGSTST